MTVQTELPKDQADDEEYLTPEEMNELWGWGEYDDDDIPGDR